MGWYLLGIKFHVVPRTLPTVGRIRQKVMHLIGLVIIKPQFLEGKVYPARLFVSVIQIHND